jgi:hypothetical protein
MRSVISTLTAVSVLLHVVLGCCAHHGHAEETAAQQPAPAACVHHGCSSQTHAKPTPPADSRENAPPSDEREDDCEQGDCAFSATVEKAETLAKASPGAWLLPDAALAGLSRQLGGGQCVNRHDPPERPVRAHLLYGVLLN